MHSVSPFSGLQPVYYSETSVKNFILECQVLLKNGGLSKELIDRVFSYWNEGRFDNHLDLFILLIQECANKGANFDVMVTLEPGMHSYELFCGQVALKNYQKAPQVFEIISQTMDCSILLGYVFERLADGHYDTDLIVFNNQVQLLLQKEADLNVKIREISIGNDRFSNVSCLHVLYLVLNLKKWGKKNRELLEKFFDEMLISPTVDVRSTFSEEFSQRTPD